jgi:Mrp family chromosome partitioning ATPase
MHEHGWRKLGVVAARRADGKSTLAGNLAVAIATDPRCSAVLVDLDVSAPWVASAFGVPDGQGLASCLIGDVALDECVFAPTGVGRLEIVTLAAEGDAVDPAIVALPSLATTLSRLAEREDSIVIVDLPAVLDSDAALTAAPLCDCLVFAVREGITTRADLERGLGLLAAVPVLGTVLVDSLTAPVGETVRD